MSLHFFKLLFPTIYICTINLTGRVFKLTLKGSILLAEMNNVIFKPQKDEDTASLF